MNTVHPHTCTYIHPDALRSGSQDFPRQRTRIPRRGIGDASSALNLAFLDTLSPSTRGEGYVDYGIGRVGRGHRCRADYGGGKTLAIIRAQLAIGGHALAQDVSDIDTGGVFDVELPLGPTHLSTRFTDGEALDVCACYVYV